MADMKGAGGLGGRERNYLSTFVPGFEEPVRSFIGDLPLTEINTLLSGLILYRSAVSPEDIESMPFFNNSFLVIADFDVRDTGTNIPTLMNELLTAAPVLREKLNGIEFYDPTDTSFRIMAYSENRPVSLSEHAKQKVERLIGDSTGLEVNRGEPDREFWLLRRRNGRGFFLLRLTENSCGWKLKPGELRSELASLLCLVAGFSPDDSFLDPFCGYGALPLARAQLGDYKEIWALDRDQNKVDAVKKRAKQRGYPRFHAETADAFYLADLNQGPYNLIVTDPPWGIFEEIGMNISRFYFLMLREFLRITTSGTTIVVLTARKKEFKSLVAATGKLVLTDIYDILVAGKKAAAYRLRRQ